jgi:hypothetical protein
MSASGNYLEKLARLSREDRDWILARLSSGARAALREQMDVNFRSRETDEPAPAGFELERSLDSVDPAVVALRLAGEPSWVIAMILSIRPWQWEQQLLARAPTVTRLEVAQSRGGLPRVSNAMRNLLIRSLHDLLCGSSSEARFAELLDRAAEHS